MWRSAPRRSVVPLVLSASAAIACARFAEVEGPGAGWAFLAYSLLKPLTTLIVIRHAWQLGRPGDRRRQALLIGLLLSWVGDVALLWPQQGFLAGLVAFLLAHCAYLYAFTRSARLGAWPAAFVAYALLAAGVLSQLWPGVPTPLRVPVLVYVTCLAAMAAQAASAWWTVAEAGPRALAARAALGGLLFLASDAVLAFNRFHSPVPASALWILATYWTAQWLIASSLPPRQSPPAG